MNIEELEQYLIAQQDNKIAVAYAILWGIAKPMLTDEQIKIMEEVIKENYK